MVYIEVGVNAIKIGFMMQFACVLDCDCVWVTADCALLIFCFCAVR